TADQPQLAADVANTTAKLFINFMDELRLSEGQHIREQLQTQLFQSQQQLEAARERLERYKNEHSVFLYEPEYTAKLQVISNLKVELAKAEVALVGSQNTLATESFKAKQARLSRLIAEQEAQLAPLPG